MSRPPSPTYKTQNWAIYNKALKGLGIGVIGLTTSVDTRVGTEADPDLAVATQLRQ